MSPLFVACTLVTVVNVVLGFFISPSGLGQLGATLAGLYIGSEIRAWAERGGE